MLRRCHPLGVPRFAPRISPRLIAAIDRLDDERLPIAEVVRRVGLEADRLGLSRPSYQRVRTLVHESRRLHRGPSAGEVLLEVAFRARPSDDLFRLLDGSIHDQP